MPSKPASKSDSSPATGTLFVVATPIGNLSDMTLRAIETLRSVDIIAAEDTRHTRKLLTHYDIHRRVVSYHGENMEARGRELIGRIGEGLNIALVTDAGTPGISDPGALLVGQAVERGFCVTVIPGPTALVTALVGSGLSTQPFAFLGFAPPRGPNRRKFFAAHGSLPMTLVLYESPKRLARTLQDILDAWGDRRIAVARELTKQYEETFRGTVKESRDYFSGEIRGELTLVVSGAAEGQTSPEKESDWREELRLLLAMPGVSLKEAVDRVASGCGLSRRMVYQEALGKMK